MHIKVKGLYLVEASNYEKQPLLNKPSDFPFLVTKPNQLTCVMFTLKVVRAFKALITK